MTLVCFSGLCVGVCVWLFFAWRGACLTDDNSVPFEESTLVQLLNTAEFVNILVLIHQSWLICLHNLLHWGCHSYWRFDGTALLVVA